MKRKPAPLPIHGHFPNQIVPLCLVERFRGEQSTRVLSRITCRRCRAFCRAHPQVANQLASDRQTVIPGAH